MTLHLSGLGAAVGGVYDPALTDQQLADLQSIPVQGEPVIVPDSPGCYPTGFVGPIPPGGVYCATGTGANPLAATSSMPWGTLGLVLGGLVLLSMVGGRR